ncbi:MmcQ/YjbR family DNA-binding protein [Chryseobacterium taeanense]|nr:MmcQ/YjbR family DNA-binding protein [Chryseobacterium taeanense]
MKNKIQHFDPKDFEAVKNIALNFPGAEESISHEGTPSVKVRGKLMCRLHDSGEFIPVRLDFEIRDHYLERYPEIFHLPDHFKPYPYLCMWTYHYDKKLLHEILELSWKGLATKKQISEYEAEKKNNGL